MKRLAGTLRLKLKRSFARERFCTLVLFEGLKCCADDSVQNV